MTEKAVQVAISPYDGYLQIEDLSNGLSATHKSQLSFWGFKATNSGEAGTFIGADEIDTFVKIVKYLEQEGISLVLHEDLRARLNVHANAKETLLLAQEMGGAFKKGVLDGREFQNFVQELSNAVVRPLKDHQVKAAYHMYTVGCSANFSVPGSGKTSVVLSVFELLRRRGEVNVLFVVGPPSCFAPWRAEYELTLGRVPQCEILAGGDRSFRKSRYAASSAILKDLYLTTYQSLLSDQTEIAGFLNHQGISAFLIIDEAHYIKQLNGNWASAVLRLSSYAKRRGILTGTPIPRSHTDAFNLFDFLWPDYSPLSQEDKIKIRISQDSGDYETARQVLDANIGSLFYRVRKSELGLMPAAFHPPTMIEMNKYERQVYDAIENRIRSYAEHDYLKNVDFVRKLQKGRMVRLRQCISNVALLSSALREYKEELIPEESVAAIIASYAHLEIPAKAELLLRIVSGLVSNGEKVLVWTNFIGTLKLLRRMLTDANIKVKAIFGETPIERTSVRDAETREQIIAEFKTQGLDVLILNPAACAESISLHTVCQHAIYYDLSYNLAQYLQSLDRVHRVGGSEIKQAHYHFLQYVRTIEGDIYGNLADKADRMYAIIEKDYAIYSLDMLEDDGDVAAYERLFG